MGGAVGVRLAAAETRITAAVLGLVASDGMTEAAASITIPVEFLLQWHDEAVPLEVRPGIVRRVRLHGEDAARQRRSAPRRCPSSRGTARRGSSPATCSAARSGRAGRPLGCPSGVDRGDAGQVAEAGLGVAGQDETAGLGGVRGDDQIVRAARAARPGGRGRAARVVRRCGRGVVETSMTEVIVASALARSAARSGVSASSIPVRYSAMISTRRRARRRPGLSGRWFRVRRR